MRTSRLVLSLMSVFVLVGLASPVYAQEAAEAAGGNTAAQWSIITAGFALAIAALGAALGQGKAVASALITRVVTLWLGVLVGAVALRRVSRMLGGAIDLDQSPDAG